MIILLWGEVTTNIVPRSLNSRWQNRYRQKYFSLNCCTQIIASIVAEAAVDSHQKKNCVRLGQEDSNLIGAHSLIRIQVPASWQASNFGHTQSFTIDFRQQHTHEHCLHDWSMKLTSTHPQIDLCYQHVIVSSHRNRKALESRLGTLKYERYDLLK